MFFDILLTIFTLGLLIVPLSSDYSRNRLSRFYNKIFLTLFRIPEGSLISEYGKYRDDGSLALKQYFYSGNLLKETHYMNEAAEPYATYYYANNLLSRVEFYSENKVVAMNLDAKTPNRVPSSD